MSSLRVLLLTAACLHAAPLLFQPANGAKYLRITGACNVRVRRPMLAMSDTYITMPVIVHELVDGPVPEDELEEPEALDRRSCLYRIRVPPDQLNPLVQALRARLSLCRARCQPSAHVMRPCGAVTPSSVLVVMLRAVPVPTLAPARRTGGPEPSACQHAHIPTTALHHSAPQCTALRCRALYCAVLHCAVLYVHCLHATRARAWPGLLRRRAEPLPGAAQAQAPREGPGPPHQPAPSGPPWTWCAVPGYTMPCEWSLQVVPGDVSFVTRVWTCESVDLCAFLHFVPGDCHKLA
jgi:hypothetical protein